MTRQATQLDKVVQYVKDELPSSYPLVGKGWTALPRMEWELEDEDAMPDEESDDEAEEEAAEE